MCKKNDTTSVKVKIASDLSHTGKEYWKSTKIDRCISGLVSALQEGGINMRSSCCGHGKGPGEITLQDGRQLIVHSAEQDSKSIIRILEFRDMIEEQYKHNPTGAGNSFGEILCYEIHHGSDGEHEGGLTFLWLAEKWHISVTFLGEVISDHCAKLEKSDVDF